MSEAMKKIRVEVIAEVTIPAKYYPGLNNDQIAKLEKNQWNEWIFDEVISEKITVTDVKNT
jgi:hypothetical protein